MGVSINWQNPDKTALILAFTAPWQWHDYEIISHTIQDMFDSVSHEIDLIIDLREADYIPDHILAQFRDAYADGTSNLGQYIFVGASSDLIERLAVADRYFSALGGILDYQCVDTLEEAQRISQWKYLTRQYDANLSG